MTRVLGLLFAATLLAGCGATSLHPLSDATTTKRDDGLVGRWVLEMRERGKPPAAVSLVVGRRPGAPEELEAAWVELGPGETVRVVRLRLLPTSIGRAELLSATSDDVAAPDADGTARPVPPAAPGSWFLGRYRRVGDALLLAALSEDEVAADIESGKIDGRVVRHETEGTLRATTREVVLTAPTERLRAWVAREGDRIWSRKWARFRRVSGP